MKELSLNEINKVIISKEKDIKELGFLIEYKTRVNESNVSQLKIEKSILEIELKDLLELQRLFTKMYSTITIELKSIEQNEFETKYNL